MSDVAVEPTPAQRSRWRIEVAVVLCVGVLPPLFTALASHPTEQMLPGPLRQWVTLLARSIQVLALPLYIIWRSPDGWEAFGWRRWSFVKDFLTGIPLAYLGIMCAQIGVLMGESVLGKGGFDRVMQSHFREVFQVHGWMFALMVVALIANSFAEEVVVRGFLIPRFTQLTRSPGMAVLLSSVLFGSYHIYQGPLAVCGVFAMGLVLGAAFVINGRIAPLIVAHTVFNLYQSIRR